MKKAPVKPAPAPNPTQRPEVQVFEVEVRHGTSPIKLADQLAAILRQDIVSETMLSRMAKDQLHGNIAFVVQDHRGQDPAVTLGTNVTETLRLLSGSMGWRRSIMVATMSHMADYRRAPEAMALFARTPGTMFQSDLLERQPRSTSHTFVAFLHDSPARLIVARQLDRRVADLIDVVIMIDVKEVPATTGKGPSRSKKRGPSEGPSDAELDAIEQEDGGSDADDLAAMAEELLPEPVTTNTTNHRQAPSNGHRPLRRGRGSRHDRDRPHFVGIGKARR